MPSSVLDRIPPTPSSSHPTDLLEPEPAVRLHDFVVIALLAVLLISLGVLAALLLPIAPLDAPIYTT